MPRGWSVQYVLVVLGDDDAGQVLAVLEHVRVVDKERRPLVLPHDLDLRQVERIGAVHSGVPVRREGNDALLNVSP